MDLRQLASLVAIAEGGSISRAALALNLAQPSLSRQIALLEAELGQRLLVRTGRGVAPTAAGQALLVHARAMLAIARQARDELQDLGAEPTGRLTVGMPPRVAASHAAPLIQRFRQRFPKATITVSEGLSVGLREALASGRLDLALLFDPAPSPQLSYELLQRERLLLVAPPTSRLPARVGLAALAQYPMVLPGAPNAIRGLLDGVLAPRGIALNVLAEAGAVQTVLRLVAEGIGCTVLPEGALPAEASGGGPTAARPRAGGAAAAATALARAPIGPPAIWNRLVLAWPLARPGSRLIGETAQLIRRLDFGGTASTPRARAAPRARPGTAP